MYILALSNNYTLLYTTVITVSPVISFFNVIESSDELEVPICVELIDGDLGRNVSVTIDFEEISGGTCMTATLGSSL